MYRRLKSFLPPDIGNFSYCVRATNIYSVCGLESFICTTCSNRKKRMLFSFNSFILIGILLYLTAYGASR